MRALTATDGPLWVSPFRPFYLLGTLYGIALMAAWLGMHLGGWRIPSANIALHQWHGHEMLFGFAAAIVVGITLTALPSWIGVAEIRGGLLFALVALWAMGRLAIWVAALLPQWGSAAIDLLFFPAVSIVVAPMLWRAPNRWYLLLLPILAALTGANAAWHAGVIGTDPTLASRGLRAAVHALIVLYVLKGGVLTPVFTAGALRERGRGDPAPFLLPLETAAVAVVVLLAVLDLCDAPAEWRGAAALSCALLHGWRVARWKGWLVFDVPLVCTMHLGFVWLLFAFVLKAVSDLTGVVPETSWIHALTVGSLGMMMIGLMTRVVLRHTGRPLVVPPAMLAAYALMFAAALLRLAAPIPWLGNRAIALATGAWILSFAIYLALYAHALLRPSRPRDNAAGGS